MDPLVVLLIAALVIVAVAVAFVFVRNKQRRGSVLAAPEHVTRSSEDGPS